MTNLCLFAESKISTWLTPVWILGLGFAAGALILLLLWGICFGFSRIPAVGSLLDHPRRRRWVGGVIAGLIFVAAIVFIIGPQIPEWRKEGVGTAAINIPLTLVVWAALAIVAGFSCVALVSRKTVAEAPAAVRESVLFPVAVVVLLLGGFSIAATFFIPQKPWDILASLQRLPNTGKQTQAYDIPAADIDASKLDDYDGYPIDVSLRAEELQQLEFEGNTVKLEVAAVPLAQASDSQIITVPAGEKTTWKRGSYRGPNPDQDIDTLYVRNRPANQTPVSITTVTAPEYPQVAVIPVTAICVVAFFLLYIVQRALMPRLSAIALATAKSEIAQPLFTILACIAGAMLAAFVFIPFFTFGEDIKMLKDTGLTVILVVGIFLAVWAASKSVAEEIEGRTALTVLSKPIGRRQFVLGKFLGISWAVALLFVILGIWLLICVAYKPIYDGQEGGRRDVAWQVCFTEMVLIIPGIVLAFMEVVIFAALSVAISTRLPIMANFLVCFAIYVMGHLTPLMVQSSIAVEAFEPVVFIGQLIATVLPVLDHFNIQAAVSAGREVPAVYLGWTFIYCLIYCTVAMLLALVFFEDRDLT